MISSVRGLLLLSKRLRIEPLLPRLSPQLLSSSVDAYQSSRSNFHGFDRLQPPLLRSPSPALSFAASFATKPSEKKGGSSETFRRRRSSMRLFSCRNDRFRSAFEQIWPTLRLTESELNLFKRNSRMFVVDTGKSISLKHKFNLSRPLAISEEGSDRPKKPYYAEAKAALFESDFHLDGAGEHPRYLKIRKIRTQFGIRLQNLRKVRLLLGFARRRYIQKAYEQTRVQPGSSKAWKLISTIESRLGSFALRSGLASDILAARKLLRGKLLVNGNLPMHLGPQAHVVQPGDILMPVDARKSGARIALNLGSGFLSEVRRTAL